MSGGRKVKDKKRKEKKSNAENAAIPHRRAETKSTLIRYKRFPTCLTPWPYRYRSVTHGEPERARARAHTATGVSRVVRRLSLSVIVARYQRSSSLARRGGVCGDEGCRFHRRKTNVISRSRQGPRSSRIQSSRSFGAYIHEEEKIL